MRLLSNRPGRGSGGKNLLVIAAPLAAGVLDEKDVLVKVAGTLFAFTMVAGAVYLNNEVHDAESDRQHPRKRLRPVAAGRLPAPTALGFSLALAVGGLALG